MASAHERGRGRVLRRECARAIVYLQNGGQTRENDDLKMSNPPLPTTGTRTGTDLGPEERPASGTRAARRHMDCVTRFFSAALLRCAASDDDGAYFTLNLVQ